MLARVFTEQRDHCNSYDVKCCHIVKTAAVFILLWLRSCDTSRELLTQTVPKSDQEVGA